MTQQDPGLPGGQPDVEPPVAEAPVAELPLGQPGIYVPVAETPAAAPRKSVVLPAVLAVVMLLAAGAFVALWPNERADHKTTADQVPVVQAEIADTEKKTGAAQTAYSDAEKRLKESEAGLAEKKAEADRNKPCSETAQELIKTIMENPDLNASRAVGFLLVERCK